MPKEIMIPALDIPVVKEMLYDTVKDKYRNVKGLLALYQQNYFSTLNEFQRVINSGEEYIVTMLAENPDNKRFMERLNLAGETLLDIAVEPGTVEIQYPKYDSRYEYKAAGMYNTVAIENPSEKPVVILRIKKVGDSLPEILFVGKKNRWNMKKWSEVLLYPDKNLFDKRVKNVLKFFDISQKEFFSAVNSFKEGPPPD
ncbi:MAG: hypothetical protein PVF58_12810 [Candidatus Methanofastidiosia archaeon]